MAKTIKEEDLRLNILINGGDEARKQILDLEASIADVSDKLAQKKKYLAKLDKWGFQESVEYKNVTAEIKAMEEALSSAQSRLESGKRQLSINSMTLAELRKHAKLTRIALSNSVPGTKDWEILRTELVNTKNRMKELDNQSKATRNTLCETFSKASKYIQTVVGGVYSVVKASQTLRKTTDAYAEYDEALTDAMKTTNLSKREVSDLSEQLKKIDTKTSQNELLSLLRAGGKLGIEGADNLMGFVRAADKINVALSEDLGGNAEAAITSIGKMTDIFGLQEKYGTEKAMLKVGSAINVLGMASTANEGYIVDFSKRLAGIAPNAGISIAHVLGLSATLDKFGQQSETSATAVGQTIIAMFKRTETFAEIAKMSVEDFRDLLNKDVNEALLRVLEGMNDGNGLSSVVSAMEEMHLNGQRASTVLGTMSKNVAELRFQQQLANEAFNEGISLDEEFNVKNTSITAQIEKRKKAIQETTVTIGQTLMPLAKGGMTVANVGLKVLSSTISTLMKYKASVISLSIVLAAYIAYQKLSFVWSKNNRKAIEAEVIALNEAKASTMALVAVKNLLVGNFKAAAAAAKMFGKALLANPAGLVVAGFAALGVAISAIWSKSRETTKALRELNKQTKDTTTGYVEAKTKIDKERESLEKLRDAVLKSVAGSNARAEAIRAINDRYGDYLPRLLTERDSNEQIKTALEGVNTELERKILLQTKENELQDVLKHKTDTVKAALESYGKLFEKINGRNMNADEISAMTDLLSRTYDNAQKDGSDLNYRGYNKTAFKSSGRAFWKERESLGLKPETEHQKRLLWNINEEFQEAIRNGKELQAVVDGLFKADLSGNGGSLNPDGTTNGTTTTTTTTTNGSPEPDGDKWSLSKDEAYLNKVLDLKNRYAAGEIASKEDFDRQFLELEIATLSARIAANKESGEDLLKLQEQLADKRISLEERNRSAAEQQSKDTQALLDEVNKDRVAAEERRYQEEKSKFQGNAAALEAVEKKHQTNLLKIRLDGISEREAAAKRERDLAIATAKNRHTEELAAFQGTKEELKALKERQAQELAQIDMQYIEKMRAILSEIMSIDGDLTTDGKISIDFAGLSSAELDAIKQKLQELISLRNQATGKTDAADSSGNDSSSAGNELHSIFEGTGGGSLFGVSQEQWTSFFKNLEDGKLGAEGLATAVGAVGGAAQEAMNLASMWLEKQSAEENNQLKAYQKSNDKKKKALQDRLDSGLITEGQYNAEVERMDAEYDAYQEELQLKQAKRQKQMQLVQAIINTATGVTTTLAQWGIPAGLVPAALMAAMGAAEIATISSTPISAGAQAGGFSDVVRAQDGKKFKARLSPDKRGFITSTSLLVSENGGEYVIPAEGLENPTLLPFINTMETARKNGRLKNLNFESIYPAVVGRASGGFAGGSPASNSEITQVIQSDPELKTAITTLIDVLSHPITAQVSMLGKNGIVEKQEEYERYRRRGKL